MRNRQNLLRNKSLTFWGHIRDIVPVGFFFTPLEGNLNVWHITEKNDEIVQNHKKNKNGFIVKTL